MGLGGIYTGIGLAKGLGESSKSFVDSYYSALDAAKKRAKEDLEQKIAQRDFDRKAQADQLQQELFEKLSQTPDYKTSAPKEDDKPVGAMGAVPVDNRTGRLYEGTEQDQITEENRLTELAQGRQKKEDQRGIDEYSGFLNDLTSQNKDLRQRALQLASLTGNTNLISAVDSLIEERTMESAAKLKGIAGKDLKKVSLLINAISGNQGLSLDKIPSTPNEQDRSGSDEMYILRDAQGNAVAKVSALELASLNTPANIKQFMKDKKDEAAQLRVEGAKLQAEVYKLTVQLKNAISLEGVKSKNAMALQEKVTKGALAVARLKTFGDPNTPPFVVATSILQGKQSVVYATTNKPNIPQILTQQEAIKFAQELANSGGDMKKAFAAAGKENAYFAGFTQTVPQGQQNAITINRIGNPPPAGGGLGGDSDDYPVFIPQ